MSKLMMYLRQKRTLIVLILLFLINSALFVLPFSPVSSSRVIENAPGATIPDMEPGYTANDVYTFLEDIGGQGRQLYRLIHLTTDLAFPLVYGLLFFALISRLIIKPNSPIKTYAPLFPLIAAAFDLSENFTLNYITRQFPNEFPGLIRLAQFFTLAKFTFLMATLLVTAYLAFRLIRQKQKA